MTPPPDYDFSDTDCTQAPRSRIVACLVTGFAIAVVAGICAMGGVW